MELHYQLEFFSQWRCDAGTSFGAATDNAVVRDGSGLPYFPGKTLKGLLREAAEDLDAYTGGTRSDQIETIFGGKAVEGVCHFSDATFAEAEAAAIRANSLQKYLFHAITTTALEENGIAKDNSLRTIEAVVPCTLYGTIYNVPTTEAADLLTSSTGFIKYIGMHRNRGFGRCRLSIIGKGGDGHE